MSDEESDEEGEALNLTSFLFGNIRRCLGRRHSDGWLRDRRSN
jgi:hypothetical protein